MRGGDEKRAAEGESPLSRAASGPRAGQPVVTCPTLMKPYLLAMRLASGKPPAILTAQWLV